MANEIDILMDLDPLELTKDDKALTAIIGYYRNARAQVESGAKPKKETGPKAKIDLSAIVKNLAPKAEAPTPPSGGKGLRRI